MQNPFQKLAGFFKQAVQAGGNSVVGIDVGSAYLKLVQLRKKGGKAVLETYGSLALGPYAGIDIGRATRLYPDTLAQALRDLMREAHVTGGAFALAIPFSSSLVMTITMPPLPEQELAAAVPLEARKYVPVPISEVALDWWVIPEEPGSPRADVAVAPAASGTAEVATSAEGRAQPRGNVGTGATTILIAAVHNEAMTRFKSIAEQARLAPRFFESEVFATLRGLFPQDLGAHAVLDCGAGDTKLYLFDRGVLRSSHSIPTGAQDLTLALSRALSLPVGDAEKLKRRAGLGGEAAASLQGLLHAMFAEVERAREGFSRRFGREVDDVTLTGGGANLPGLAEFAISAAGLRAVRANPFALVEAPAFLDAVLREAGPEFSVALGVALRLLEEG